MHQKDTNHNLFYVSSPPPFPFLLSPRYPSLTHSYFFTQGRVPKLKSAKVWSLTIEEVTQNQILIQTSFCSVNLAIFSANLENSE